MPFAEEFEEVYEYAIAPAAEDAGFHCHRADHAVGPSAIISDIVNSIFAADVVVADITESNPNVFYELGVAHAIENKTLVICEKTKQELPFDLAAYRVLFYYRTIKGVRTDLRETLKKHLTQLDIWKKRPNNPVQNFRPVKYAVPLQSQTFLERRIKELREEIREARKETRRAEARTIILALREIELRHLKKLLAEGPFVYDKHSAFLDELRKLRSLHLIKNRPGTNIGGIPQSGNLKDYLELTAPARDVLEEIIRLFGAS